MAEQLPKHETVVVEKLALQSQLQLRDLRLHAATGRLGQFRGIFFSVHQPIEHFASRNAQNVAGYRSQLDVGVLQELVDAIGDSRVFTLQLSAMAGQIPQFALWPRRHETAPQQAVLQQLGNPLGVLDVSLAARNLLQFSGVDQQQLEIRLQDVPHGFPQNSRGFHGHMGHTIGLQPIRHFQKVAGHRTEGTQIPLHFCCGADLAYRRNSGFLMQVQSCHTRVDYVHSTPRFCYPATWGYRKRQHSASRAPQTKGATIAGSRRYPDQTVPRARGSTENRPSTKPSEVILRYYTQPNFHHSRCRAAA